MKQTTTRLDPYYLYLDVARALGHGRAFLLDAAAESTSRYQMSLVAGAPVLEIQVKDGITSLFALDGLDDYLVGYLSQEGISPEDVGSVNRPGEAAFTPATSVVRAEPIVYTGVDPMRLLESIRQGMRVLYGTDEHSVPFSAGFLGYIGYDAVHYLEKLPKTTLDDRQLPDIRLQVHALVVQLVHDEVSVYSGLAQLADVLAAESFAGVERDVDRVSELLRGEAGTREPGILVDLNGERATAENGNPAGNRLSAEANESDTLSLATDDVSQEKFEENVRRAREYIGAGDIFQVVLSKRVKVARRRHAYEIYDELRRLNPSPYMFIAEYADMRVFGASPEVQFRCVGGIAEMKPIAGTSKGRGKTPEADRALAEALFNDEKERAEHVMLVDLCRNDLGRVCEIGSVKVHDLMHVEAYSHLFHLVSEVTGQLRTDVSVFHALLATFPAGTLSGAPKIRAMEIIDELETLRRGPYGGMIGMVDFNANANTAIVIRTIVEAHDAYYVQVGAGIVADSDPAQEWLECGHKAGAVLQVLGVTP